MGNVLKQEYSRFLHSFDKYFLYDNLYVYLLLTHFHLRKVPH